MPFIDSLIDTYKPEQEKFDVFLPQGEKLTFRMVGSYDEHLSIQRGARKLVANVASKTVPPAALPYLPDEPETTVSAYALAATIVEPQMKEMDWLKLAKCCAYVFSHILTTWNQNQFAGQSAREVDEVEELKND